MRRVHRFSPIAVAALTLLVAAFPLAASTIAPPSNLGELARISRSVVLAEAQGARSELAGNTPVTITRFQLVQAVAGANPGRSLQVRQMGGEVGEVGLAISGAVKFEKGSRYLLFLDPVAGGRWQLKMMAYGVLKEDGEGLLRPVPEAAELQVLPRPGIEKVGAAYRSRELLRSLAGAANGAPWSGKAAEVAAVAAVAEPAPEKTTAQSSLTPITEKVTAPAVCQYLHANDNLPVRWFGFETGSGAVSMWHTTPGQVGISDGGVAAVQQGAGAWTNDPNTAILLNYAGSRPTSATCAGGVAEQHGVNEVTFNDPCNELPDLTTCTGTIPAGWSSVCCGQVAVGGVFYNTGATQTHDGDQWRSVDSGFVVVNNGSQCLGETDFQEMMTHQLGHALGFWHHNDQNATMYAQLGVHPSRGAALAKTDLICSAFAYHSFLDVPLSNFAWKFIEAVKNAGVITGCGGANFCPTGPLSREQMARYLLLAKEGSSYVPPACTTPIFNDVPCSSPFAPFINELYHRGVVAGCGNGNYCPANTVTREQVAVFLIATKEGTSYHPAACTTPQFADVPCSSPFAPWVQELVNRGLTAGCGNGNYCPQVTISQAEVSVFLTGNFSLPYPSYP